MVAAVWLGRPSPWWGSARWVSAPRDLWDWCFLGSGPRVIPGCLRVDGPGLGTGLGVRRRSRSSCVWTVTDPRSSVWHPNPSGHWFSVWFFFLRPLLDSLLRFSPPPSRAKLVTPDSLQTTLDPTRTSGSLLGARRGCVHVETVFEKWSLVLLLKLMSLGRKPGDGTFGPGYHNWKF